MEFSRITCHINDEFKNLLGNNETEAVVYGHLLSMLVSDLETKFKLLKKKYANKSNYEKLKDERDKDKRLRPGAILKKKEAKEMRNKSRYRRRK